MLLDAYYLQNAHHLKNLPWPWCLKSFKHTKFIWKSNHKTVRIMRWLPLLIRCFHKLLLLFGKKLYLIRRPYQNFYDAFSMKSYAVLNIMLEFYEIDQKLWLFREKAQSSFPRSMIFAKFNLWDSGEEVVQYWREY